MSSLLVRDSICVHTPPCVMDEELVGGRRWCISSLQGNGFGSCWRASFWWLESAFPWVFGLFHGANVLHQCPGSRGGWDQEVCGTQHSFPQTNLVHQLHVAIRYPSCHAHHVSSSVHRGFSSFQRCCSGCSGSPVSARRSGSWFGNVLLCIRIMHVCCRALRWNSSVVHAHIRAGGVVSMHTHQHAHTRASSYARKHAKKISEYEDSKSHWTLFGQIWNSCQYAYTTNSLQIGSNRLNMSFGEIQ